MTQDDIIAMAEAAGFPAIFDELETFAKLVAAHEREACAKKCDGVIVHVGDQSFANSVAKLIQYSIRARGQQ